MFRISKRLDYGLQVMIALTNSNSSQPQPSAQLSEQLGIPLPFLHQIAHTLMQSGLIKASPGPRGGLRLGLPAENISVLKIAEVLEGQICVTPCLECNDDCSNKDTCPSQYMWEDLQTRIVSHLDKVTLKSLADQSLMMQKTTTEKAEQFIEVNQPVPAD